MSRVIPADLLNRYQASVVKPYFAVEMLFDTAPIRLWTGHGNRTINGNEYVGAGTFLSIKGLEEVGDLSAKAIHISLSGTSSAVTSLALQEHYQRRTVNVFIGDIEVADVLQVFGGFANTMTIKDEGSSSQIVLNVDSKLVALERASNWRYTDQSHQSRNSGDTFFSYVADLQDREVIWGRDVA